MKSHFASGNHYALQACLKKIPVWGVRKERSDLKPMSRLIFIALSIILILAWVPIPSRAAESSGRQPLSGKYVCNYTMSNGEKALIEDKAYRPFVEFLDESACLMLIPHSGTFSTPGVGEEATYSILEDRVYVLMDGFPMLSFIRQNDGTLAVEPTTVGAIELDA